MESEDSQPQTTDTATVQTTKAAEPTLLASWDFTGKNGTTNSAIADSTGKYNLTLKDGAKIEQYGDRSNNEALSLRGDGQYAQIDDQLFKDAGDSFTLEFASKTRHDDSGKFFSFIVGKDGSNDANTTDQANANKYLMFYNSKIAIKGVISNNNWGNEQGSKGHRFRQRQQLGRLQDCRGRHQPCRVPQQCPDHFQGQHRHQDERSRRDHRLHRQVVLLRR